MDFFYWVKLGEIFKVDMFQVEFVIFKVQCMDLKIVYEDEDVIVVDKFVGMVVYLVVGNWFGILVNVFFYYCCDSLLGVGGVLCLGIVYRFDKDIIGLIVVVKNDQVYVGLCVQFDGYMINWVY